MTRTRITITATTRRRWMKPPMVLEVTRPSGHRMTRTTAMVQSMDSSGLVDAPRPARPGMAGWAGMRHLGLHAP